MPYTKPEDRAAVIKDVRNVQTPGDLNFLLTLWILRAWKANPKYVTIHCLKRDLVTDPKNNPFLQEIRKRYCDVFTVADIYAAAACAYDEFARRIVTAYETKKIKDNSDIPEYVAALKELE